MDGLTNTQWQCDKSLSECVEYMFLHNLNTGDVTFTFGETCVDIKAHKFILMCRSPVFNAMFEGHMRPSEDQKIKIDDIEPGVFMSFLEYLYTDKTEINVENFCNLLYTAKKYCVDQLTVHCKKFLKEVIKIENVCEIRKCGDLFNEQEITEGCLDFIKRNAVSIFMSEEFTDLCHQCVQDLVSHEHVLVPEEVIFETVLKWSTAQCERNNIEPTAGNKRKMIGDVLYSIRFPIMCHKFLDDFICISDILTEAEKVEILRQQLNTCVSKKGRFEIKKRQRLPEKIYRLKKISGGTYRFDEIESLRFTVSENCFLYGVILYGPHTFVSVPAGGTLQVLGENDIILSETHFDFELYSEKDLYDVMLGNVILLNKNIQYKVRMKKDESHDSLLYLHYGKHAVNPVSCRGNKLHITFMSDMNLENYTDVNMGQFPGLIIY